MRGAGRRLEETQRTDQEGPPTDREPRGRTMSARERLGAVENHLFALCDVLKAIELVAQPDLSPRGSSLSYLAKLAHKQAVGISEAVQEINS
jgi:hypothetical protein